MGYPFHPG